MHIRHHSANVTGPVICECRVSVLSNFSISCTCYGSISCTRGFLLLTLLVRVLQIRVIQLSDEQKKIVLCLRKLYLQNLGILVRRRQDLSSMLQARLGTQTVQSLRLYA